MQPVFSYRVRVLACDGCGAATEVPQAGGAGSCSRCRQPLVAPARPETAVPRSPPMNEQERLMRLRQQDGRPLLPPPGLESVLGPGGAIEAWKLNEARTLWGATRKHVQAVPSDIGAAERLVFLTITLANAMMSSVPGGDDRGLRALYEGTLEAVSLPRHRQMMRGQLARGAAKVGDVEGAQAWLAGMDPGSDDLSTDSAYRLTHAFVATAMRDPQTVLRVLGGSETDVPIADHMDVMATILRANAWETMGNVEAGRALLARFMTGQGGVSGAVEKVLAAMPSHWRVCAQSMQGARVEHRRHVATRAGSGAWVGWIFLGAGFLPLVFVIPTVLFSGAPSFTFLFVLIFPVVFGLVGWKMIAAAKRSRIIAETGVAGQARVLAVNPTGTRINGVPMMRIDVQATVPGQPPIRASTTKLLHPHQAGGLLGRDLPIIWSPQYPSEVVLEI